MFDGTIHQNPFPRIGLDAKFKYTMNISIIYKFCMSSLDSYWPECFDSSSKDNLEDPMASDPARVFDPCGLEGFGKKV